MKRITCTPNYAVTNCGDLCGLLPRAHGITGMQQCISTDRCCECIILKAFQRLKAYEDTGLSPEDVRKLTVHSTIPKELLDRNGHNN